MRGSTTTWFMVAVLLVLVAVGSGYALPDQRRHAQADAEAYARDAAASLARGRVPADVEAADRNAEQTQLTSMVQGMGETPHEVTVKGIHLDGAKRHGTITFEHSWAVRPEVAPWTYRTTLPIRRRDDVWYGRWSAASVAPGLKPGERLSARTLDPRRGRITGNGGSALVTDRPVSRIGISRATAGSTDQAESSARQLAALVGIDTGDYADQVTAAGPQSFVEALVYRRPSEDLDKVTPELAKIPGAKAVESTQPLAPTSTFAASVLGRVGRATPDIVKRSNGQVRDGDLAGLTGLQSSQNARLGGAAGAVVEATSGKTRRTLYRVAAHDGRDVATTLDLTMQTKAESALRDVEPASAIVAVRPSDGHVLAAADGPGSDGYPTALLGQYAPGSTFKTVTTLALLRAGLTPSTRLDCTPSVNVDGHVFRNHEGYPADRMGSLALRDVFANSCNTGFISARDRLDSTSLNRAADAVGLTAQPNLGIPAAFGSVPETGGSDDLAASEIGQGRVLTTPLGMATVAASIAAGRTVRPDLVTDPARPGSAGANRAPITANESWQLRALMRRVVTDGTATFLRDAPGGPVMAKTGTAEFGNDDPPRTHAWMIAVQGDLAVAVFVDEGDGGAATAGPVLKDFLTQLH